MILDIQFAENSQSFNSTFGEIIKVGNAEDGAEMYLLVTGDGREIPAVAVDELTVFDATADDIRLGKIAATEQGVTLGEKVIPSYHTWQGVQVIPNGGTFSIKNRNQQIPVHDYTELQSIICTYNTTLANSVSASKVSIENDVYDVLSTTSISKITKDVENMTIDFGIKNDTGKPCIIRFFTYKEIY